MEGRRSIDDEKSSRKEDAALFNDNPKDFVRVHRDPSSVARVLFNCHPLLDVNLLGKQFGRDPERDPLWIQILREYACCFDFHDRPFLRSIRDFLFRFRLPGEAAQISRVMEAFAHAYFLQNSSSEPSSSDGRQLLQTLRKEVRGYYLRDIGDCGMLCCLSCGCLSSEDMPLYKCEACHGVTFCRKCMRMSSSFGHAFVGRIGYGPACVKILQQNGDIGEGEMLHFSPDGKGSIRSKFITTHDLEWGAAWEREGSQPFANEDAVFVFSFSVIMLTTNLHNPNVKEKMTKQQFIVTNNGINGGRNLPGDYIASIYDEIALDKIEVMV